MKQFLFVILTAAIFSNSYAQKITYQNNLLTSLQLAKENTKPVFIVIEPPSARALGTSPANLPNFTSGLDNANVAELYNKRFINYKLSITDTAYNSFRKRYPIKIDSYPAYIFLDNGGELMYKDVAVNSSSPQRYIDMGNAALGVAKSGKTITNYKILQQNNKLNRSELKQYITLRQSLGLYNNPELLDEYVNGLTVQEFNNYPVVLFLLKSGPIAYSKTYNLCFTNRKITDSIFKFEPLEVRKEINNRIITNTRNMAILKKDAVMAQQLSRFVQTTWSNDYRRGAKASSEELLYYYQMVKDTANYYRQATYFYDTFYMKLSADSIKKLQNAAVISNQQAMLNRIKQLNPNAQVNIGTVPQSVSIKNGPVLPVIATVTSGNAIPPDVPGVLNNAAYTFYTSGTRNNEHLTKALLWVKRAIEVSPDNHAYYDTMAHILYRLGFINEAIINQKKAIELAGSEKIINAAAYLPILKQELVKMQERKL